MNCKHGDVTSHWTVRSWTRSTAKARSREVCTRAVWWVVGRWPVAVFIVAALGRPRSAPPSRGMARTVCLLPRRNYAAPKRLRAGLPAIAVQTHESCIDILGVRYVEQISRPMSAAPRTDLQSGCSFRAGGAQSPGR